MDHHSQLWKDAVTSQECRNKHSEAAKKPRSQAWKDARSRNQKGKPKPEHHKSALKRAWDEASPEERAARVEKTILDAQKKATAWHEENPGHKNQEWLASLSEEEREQFLRPWVEAGQKERGSYEPSQLEDKVAESLTEYYVRQQYIGKYRVDFWFPGSNRVMEINGCFWHQCEQCGFTKGYGEFTAEEIRTLDEERIRYLESRGYTVEVVWEHDIHTVR